MKLTKLTLTKLAAVALVTAIGFGAAAPAGARDSFYVAYDNGYYGAAYSNGYYRPYPYRYSSAYYRPAYRYAYYDDPYYSRCYWRHGYRYCRTPDGYWRRTY